MMDISKIDKCEKIIEEIRYVEKYICLLSTYTEFASKVYGKVIRRVYVGVALNMKVIPLPLNCGYKDLDELRDKMIIYYSKELERLKREFEEL